MSKNSSTPTLSPDENKDVKLPLIDEDSPVSSPKKSGTSFFLWLILLLIIIVLGCIGWLQLQNIRHTIEKNSQTLNQLSDLKSTLNNQIDSNSQALAEQQQQLTVMQNNLARLNSLVTNNQDGWAIIEAKHLLQLANLSLAFEKNISATLSLLKLTDQRLLTIADPGLNNLRQLLANDVAALQSVQPVDTTGLYLRLQALKNQTLSLALVNKQYQRIEKQNILAQSSSPEHASIWNKSFTTFSQALSKVLIIRHRNNPIEPLIGADQEQLVKQNLYWLFDQAQWAVLHQQEAVYQSSLEQINQLLKSYFQLNTQSQSIAQNIIELQKINIDPTLPDISNLIPAIQQYEKTHRNLINSSNISPQPLTPSSEDNGQSIKVTLQPLATNPTESVKQAILPIKAPALESTKAEIV